MKRDQLWRLLLILFVIGWAIYELIPPTSRNLLQEFQRRAVRPDATFSNILARAQELQQAMPDRTFGNLREAIGTNEITQYFPFIDAKGQKNPTQFVLQRLQREALGKIKLGLDLQGGTSFLVGMDTNKLAEDADRSVALSHAVEVLRKRVDKFGVAEPIIQPAGTDRINIQMPGLSEAEKSSVRSLIEKAAFLEFRMVHPNSAELVAQGIVEPGYELLKEERKGRDGKTEVLSYLVNKKAERGMTGKYIKRAGVSRNQYTGEPEINFVLNDEGAKLFGEITTEYQPRGGKYFQLAIVLDGELYSAPRIMGPITGGNGQITGNFDLREAFNLANVLENPLQAPVKILTENSVDPSLGRDSIRSGVSAAIIGTLAVMLFILCYYLLAGAVANFALLLNVLILMGCLCTHLLTPSGITLTLPGIAGIVLTIGIAVDANVLIFERIREELAAGKSVRGALVAGYSKAFGTILDTNLTTLISSIILIFMGTGPVKGFGVTLTIGLIVSMFTALVVTRLIFDLGVDKGWIKSFKMLHLIRNTKFDFLRWAKTAFALSWIFILIGLGWGVHRGKEVFGYEFIGGDNITFSFKQDKKVSMDQLRPIIAKLGVGDVMLQYEKDIVTGNELLRVTTRTMVKEGKEVDSARLVEAALKSSFPESDFKEVGLNKVGPTVGRELQKNAIIAVVLSMFGILIYVAFRYEFSFAVGAVVAIIHDLLMTLGWFFLSGREMSGTFVAAMLTIVGFSINDTIVIFDRIREDLKLGVRGTFKDVINQAVNQTLSRTIITSGTVFLSTLALYLFGGGVINDFAFTFLVGILTGTYSSIYIASALVLWWHRGQRPKMAASMVLDQPVAAARA
jgi:SecD/SecF fusion protein